MSMPPQPPGPPSPPPGGPTPPPPPGGGFPGGAPAGVPRPAELQNRFLARLIDHVILGVVVMIVYFVLIAIFLAGFNDSIFEWLLFGILQGVISTALFIGYFAVLESNRGQTVGKMIMKLQTFGPDGVSKPTMEQAAKRNAYPAVLLITIIPFAGFYLAQLAMIGAMAYNAFTLNADQPNHQSFLDKFAGGTRVMQVG